MSCDVKCVTMVFLQNVSFVMNSFLGRMETAELFPFPEGVCVCVCVCVCVEGGGGCGCVCVVCMYPGKTRGEEERETLFFICACFFPAVLTEEQRQNLSMFIDPVTKFFEVRFFLT